MKKKKNKDSTIYLKIVFIVIGILAVVIVALLINKNTTSKDEVGARLEDYGYTIGEKDEAFYNKITTENVNSLLLLINFLNHLCLIILFRH